MTTSVRQSVNVPGAMPVAPYYSSSVVVTGGRLVFLSGQVAADENGDNVAVGDVRGQAEYVFDRMRKVVEYHGGTMADIVQYRVYITDPAYRAEIAPVRLAHFPDEAPVAVLIVAAALGHPDWLVEVEAIAALP